MQCQPETPKCSSNSSSSVVMIDISRHPCMAAVTPSPMPLRMPAALSTACSMPHRSCMALLRQRTLVCCNHSGAAATVQPGLQQHSAAAAAQRRVQRPQRSRDIITRAHKGRAPSTSRAAQPRPRTHVPVRAAPLELGLGHGQAQPREQRCTAVPRRQR